MTQSTQSTTASEPAIHTPVRHKAFSPSRVIAIAGATLTELVRLKVFYFLLIFAVLLIGNSAFMVKFSFQEEFQVLKDVSLGAMSIFSSILAIVATAWLLPKDVEDRTLYTILAKPVPRFEYLLGKLCGVLALLAIALFFMSVVFSAVLWFRETMVASSLKAEAVGAGLASSELLTTQLAELHNAAFGGGLFAGVVVIYLKACLLAALTLFVSTFATSSIFTIIVVVAVYFVGHFQATAREYWLAGNTEGMLTKGGLAVISLIFPDLQLFNLVDDIVAGNEIALALLMKTVGLGVLYVVIYLLLAQFIFSRKEL